MTIQPVRKISRYPRKGVRKPRPPSPPRLRTEERFTGGGIRQLNLIPEDLRAFARVVGLRRAKAAWKLMQRGLQGSLPELLTYDWLEKHKRSFQFQTSLLGGRMVRGGTVLDFVVFDLSPDGVYCWRVQGEYWHQGPISKAQDEWQSYRLRQLWIGGLPVVAVVDLWENDIYHRYPEIYQKAEFGISLRGVR